MTVSPIADYEPGAGAGSAPRTPKARRRSDGRRLRLVPPAEPSAQVRGAAMFADAALRAVLEVIDRRRTPAHLRTLLAPGLIDSVTAFAHGAPVPSGAVLRRVRLQPGDAAETAFEVAATYGRGARTHALAGRIERVATGQGAATAWQVVALHIG